jgi:hypothetical protein
MGIGCRAMTSMLFWVSLINEIYCMHAKSELANSATYTHLSTLQHCPVAYLNTNDKDAAVANLELTKI